MSRNLESTAVKSRGLFGIALALALLCGCAAAQREPLHATAPEEAATVDAVLQGMVGRARVIFLGTVLEVRRASAGEGSGAGVVEVVFTVDRGLRGASTGSRYVLREWAGLWAGNDDRYRVGQRRLMLLHAPGAGGLSSPVDGMDGAIPILPGQDARSEPLVDLRWVATRVSRGPVQYRAERPRIPRARPMAEVLHLPGEVTPVVETDVGTATSEHKSVAAEYASVSSIVTAILAWQAGSR